MGTPGQWIAERRKSLGLRREELTGRSGLSLSTIARVEQGRGEANRSTWVALGMALGLGEKSELLADWGAGLIDEQTFRSRVPMVPATPWRSVESFLTEKGLAPKKQPSSSDLPSPDFIVVASKGEGTPVLGEVTAGGMVESVVYEADEELERIPIAYPKRQRVYALLIKGDSMAPEYRPGEYLIVEDATVEGLEDGGDFVVQCDGSMSSCSTFKRCYLLGEGRVKLVPLNSAYRTIECPLESIVRIGRVLGVYRPRPRPKG